MDVLEDFKVRYNQDKIPKKVSAKSRVEESNAVNAQKRMLERKFNKFGNSQHQLLKQYKKNGKEHFLIVKKKDQMEVEDIFQDWNNNLVDVFEQRRLAADAARNNRKRKLSNRALRKELLKEINEAENNKPMSYSDIVKKNLKMPMEDIFEAWRDYLRELDDILSNDSRTSFSKGDEEAEDILESAKCYQTQLMYCGQPTIKSASKQQKPKYEKENFFAAWRHNFADANDYSSNFRQQEKYQSENYFAAWKFNLNDELLNSKGDLELEAEAIFEDWAHNLDHKLGRRDSRMLKNKQRQQRRSKKRQQQ